MADNENLRYITSFLENYIEKFDELIKVAISTKIPDGREDQKKEVEDKIREMKALKDMARNMINVLHSYQPISMNFDGFLMVFHTEMLRISLWMITFSLKNPLGRTSR